MDSRLESVPTDGSPPVAAVRVRPTVPEATIARLPGYVRALRELEAAGTSTTSSTQLAAAAGVNAAQLRRDLSHLGSYGTRGVGYRVADLITHMSRALGLTSDWPVVIVGLGHLGQALAKYQGFRSRGFRIAGLIDSAPELVGTAIDGSVIAAPSALPQLVRDSGACIGVIATPARAAQEACDRLVEAGITSILNFAPVALGAPEQVQVRTVDLSVELQILAFHEQRRLDESRGADSSTAWPDLGLVPGAGPGVAV